MSYGAGIPCSLRFTEESIAGGRWVGSSFCCKDHEGDEVQLQFLTLSFIVPEQSPSTSAEVVLDLFSTLKAKTETLDDETEVLWRLLVISLQQHDADQLADVLAALKARLLDQDDDTASLMTLPVNNLVHMLEQALAKVHDA